MSPDLAYFIPWIPYSQFSHTFPGLFLFCLPVGMVILWLYHVIVKYPTLSLLPESHQRRLLPLVRGFSFTPLKHLGNIVISLVIGALTHIAWDSFTHLDGWVVQQIHFLSTSVIDTALGPVYIYNFLQHSSSIIGITILICWYVSWYKNVPVDNEASLVRISLPFSLGVILFTGMSAFICSGVITYIRLSPALNLISLQHLIGHIIGVSLTILFGEIVLLSAGWWLVKFINSPVANK